MIPRGMFDSYRQYKNDTDVIANWLAKSATACGYEFNPHKKGKKGKAARKQQSADKTITIPQFVELATFLANHSISNLLQASCVEFLVKLDQVIEARDTHNAWYNSHIYHNEDAQIHHVFFVDILRQCRTVLGPDLVARASTSPQPMKKITPLVEQAATIENRALQQPQKKPVEARATPTKRLADIPEIRGRPQRQIGHVLKSVEKSASPSPALANQFAGLQVQDTTEEPSQPTTSSVPLTPSTPRNSSPDYKAEQVTDDQEMWLAIRCFFDDLQSIRNFAAQGWKVYASKGQTLLWLLAVVTDVALDLVRRAELEFEDHFPNHSLVQGARLLYESHCRTKKHKSIKDLAVTSLSNPFKFVDWDFIEPKLIPTLAILEELKNIEKPWARDFAACDPKHYIASPPEGSTPKTVHENQKLFLKSIYADLSLVAKFIPEIRQCDHLLQHVSILLEHKRLTIAAAFAVQVMFDVRGLTSGCYHQGFQDLRTGGLMIDRNLERSITIHEAAFGEDTARGTIESFRDVFQLLDDIVLSDAIKVQRRKLGFKVNKDVENYLLTFQPLLCGTLLFKCKWVAARDATGWCNSTSAITKAMHLYNACRAEGFLTEDWKAMEELIDIYGSKHLFIGSRPTNNDDYYKRFCLASGYSPRFFARDACGCLATPRGKLVNLRKARGFNLTEVAPILSRLHDRFQGDDRAVAEAMFRIEQRQLPSEVRVADKDENGNLINIRKATGNKPHLTKVILLDKLAKVLKEELPALNFDYLKLERECWAMFEMLVQSMTYRFQDLGYDSVRTGFSKKFGVPSIVFPLLSEVSLERSEASCVDCKVRFSTSGLSMLKEAAKVVETAIKDFDGNKMHTMYKLKYQHVFMSAHEAARNEGVKKEDLTEWMLRWMEDNHKSMFKEFYSAYQQEQAADGDEGEADEWEDEE